MKSAPAALIERLDTNHLSGALILGAVMLVLGLVLSRLVRRVLKAELLRDPAARGDEIAVQFLGHLAILAIWMALATVYAHLVPALSRLSAALLAGVSLVSITIGFAAQQTLGNLVAGIGLILYKPFRRGDRLQVLAPTKEEFEVGAVEDITLGYTLLRTDDGREIIIANATMAQGTMIKLTPNKG